MFDAESYLSGLTGLLQKQFGAKLLYVGLQGSYLRGEATENSDIDIMVILDELGVSEMDQYRDVILSLECSDRSCGFICGRKELANWNPLEICHLLHTTKDYYGVLQDYIPLFTEQDVRNFTKVSVNNLYHEICHRYIHGDTAYNQAALPGSYKGVFFILQNLYYLTHGRFIVSKAELLPLLEGKNHAVLQRAMDLNSGKSYDFSDSFTLLFAWCQETMGSLL